MIEFTIYQKFVLCISSAGLIALAYLKWGNCIPEGEEDDEGFHETETSEHVEFRRYITGDPQRSKLWADTYDHHVKYGDSPVLACDKADTAVRRYRQANQYNRESPFKK